MEQRGQPLGEGDLQAYVDGERPAEIEEALATTPELRENLRLIKGANTVLQRLFADAPLPGPHDLVDVATGQAAPAQQLRVAAYLRVSPTGRAQMAELLEIAGAGRVRSASPSVLALPMLAAAGLKSGAADEGDGPVFLATEFAAQVVITLAPLVDDNWLLRGYLDQHGVPVAQAPVTLYSSTGSRRTRSTDAGGFFTFKALPVGSYHLRIMLEQGVLLTTPFTLPYGR